MCWTAGYDVGGDGTEPQSRLWDVKEAAFIFFIAEMIYEVMTGSWFDAHFQLCKSKWSEVYGLIRHLEISAFIKY